MSTAPVMKPQSYPAPQQRPPLGLVPQPAALQPAGFWERFAAAFIDGLIITAVQAPFQYLMDSSVAVAQREMESGDPERVQQATMMLLVLAIGKIGLVAVLTFAYYGLFYRSKGATPGKLALGLRVIDMRRQEYPGLGATFLREFVGKTLSAIFFMIGYLMAGFRSDKRAMHDLMAGTQVIRKPRA
ncbi:MAG: RDD family protein [Bdellovibrionales bacterium]|nr:RDD family protein [Bdellovibrionales bacterium]